MQQTTCFEALLPGHPFEVPPPLFRKLEDSNIQELRGQFGGRLNDRKTLVSTGGGYPCRYAEC
nr:hypothetical protein [Allocoleopsis franciscana]